MTLAGLAEPLVVRVFTRDATSCQKEVALWRLAHDRVPAPAFAQGVIAGYTSGGDALPPDWKRVIRLIDLVNLLTFLDTPDSHVPMIDEVVGLVRATVDHWDIR